MALKDNIRKTVPYVPGEQPQGNVIKLNTNECPYPPAPGVSEALKRIGSESCRLYPDPECSALRRALAGYYSLKEEQIFVGVGSDDVLSMCFLTFFNSGRPVLFPDITYSFYEVWADVYRIPYIKIPLREDFTLNPADYSRENGGIIIANPNAPTGLVSSLEDIESILEANRESIVIVDEAYIDFGGQSALPLLKSHENLVITRTMSKSRALAGMRVGYAFASEELTGYLNDVKFSINSYTMNLPALAAGVAAIEDDACFRQIISRIVATREWTKAELEKLGFSCLDSSANFLFATHREKRAVDLFNYLKAHGVYVRYFNKPRIDNYLRISIGTEEQMREFVEKIRTFI